jgi:hypothetical protein
VKEWTLTILLILFVGLAAETMGQDRRVNSRHRLYSGHEDVFTKKETPTVTSSETTSGQTISQVFYSKTGQRRELFRADIGFVINSERVKLWNYGIVSEGDFNRDGLPDYFWYGGDDSGESMHLFLSSKRGYTKVDIHQTLKAAWKQRFNRESPEWANVDSDFLIGEIYIEDAAGGLVLFVTVDPGPLNSVDKNSYEFRIRPSDFK